MIEPGTTLCDVQINASLDKLVGMFSSPEFAGAEVELWVFDGRERREKARKALETEGVIARVRSAYKPLVHAVLEELDFDGVKEISIRYPVVDGVLENRFLLETYPVGELVGARPVTFEPSEPVDGSGLISYQLVLKRGDGSQLFVDVPAPNLFRPDHVGHGIYTATGWIRVRSPDRPDLDRNEPYRTDQEQAFDAVMTILSERNWEGEEPFFDRLNMRVEAPFYDRPLPFAHECLSTAEAMHEDLYFSALDMFKKARGLDLEDRTLRPGQLVPQIVPRTGPLRVVIETGSDPYLETDRSVQPGPLTDLETAGHWLEPGVIKAHVDDLGGDYYEVRSQRGRPVWSTHIAGQGPAMVITAGQHSNETSGPIGALRAARHMADKGRTGFAVSPLVNPDGYALFRELCRNYPDHMNHAARFTASGCDLQYVERGFENEAHHIGQEKTGARLHLNLHGYPAHEWTRPFSGYVPRGAELWTIPKGFFLILLHKPGWKSQGEVILNAIIEELSGYQPIVDLNREQCGRSRLYTNASPFMIREDIPYTVEEVEDSLFPVTIITEAPDEMVYGDAFSLLHTAQMKSVLAAADACPSAFS
ncbi:M14 family zinc carboxypeptidase [Hoeflea sp. TYP-13]|uniref:M14 family zinc carboxypeptidase n=1 Tax=Hoeflea sp. TYP-13 TaxID=3230023 RepID=UPI0034C6C920